MCGEHAGESDRGKQRKVKLSRARRKTLYTYNRSYNPYKNL